MRVERLLGQARKLRAIAAVPAYREGARHGVFASTEHLHDPIPPDIRTVVDVGANRGQFALVAQQRWRNARLICFEPLASAVKKLEQVTCGRAEIVQCAVSDSPGRAALHISRADDSSSLLDITPKQVTTFPGTEEVGTIEVETVTLDQAVSEPDRPSLLKIDVQGFELQVLRGARALLDEIDHVIVECSFAEFYAGQASADAVIRLLHTAGFALAAATAPTVGNDGIVLQLDLIFRRH